MTGQAASFDAEGARASLAGPADYLALLKPRVMSLVVFTALAAMIVAPGAMHPVVAFTALICIAVGAGAAGALNQWFDADIDAIMTRTRTRPVASGKIGRQEALEFGATLAAFSVFAMAFLVGYVPAILLAATIAFYVFVYTMWLKRSTQQNIVIGGAAGAFPPAVAWAAATGGLDAGAIALFLIIFMWTPPHFWALALFREGDYGNAGVPMMPNVSGRAETKKQILIYNVLLMPTVLLPLVTGIGGWLYGVGAIALTSKFLWHAFVLYRTTERSVDEDKASKKLFGTSIYWLFALLGLILVEQLFNLSVFPAWI